MDSQNSHITSGTTAEFAYDLYCTKKKQIDELEYECSLLVDKYHSEMKCTAIPYEFGTSPLLSMFDNNPSSAQYLQMARDSFLKRCFSSGFLKKHTIEFVTYQHHGYESTAIGVVLGIGKYDYTIEFPQPRNIYTPEAKKALMGQVKFRVDRYPRDKKDDFCKAMESVCLPTYNWKDCFAAIERMA